MGQQIKSLVRLELCNVFSLNVQKHTGDKKTRRKAWFMTGIYGFLALFVSLYIGAMSYGLILLGAGEAVAAYLIVLASLFIFLFGAFTSGGILFRRNGYDILCSLPVSRGAIVFSRFVRMYVENLVFAFVVMAPGIGVYSIILRPDFGFYPSALMGILVVPLIPAAAAALAGALITGLSSRMKYKSLAEAALSILVVLAVFLFAPAMEKLEGNITPEMLMEVAGKVSSAIGVLYPPAAWLGNAIIQGNLLGVLPCAGVSVGCFGVVLILVAANHSQICSRLFRNTASHDYRMKQLKQNSLLTSMCMRELNRYVSSGTYISNTIVGPVMAAVLSGSVYFMGIEKIRQMIPLPTDLSALVPVLVGGVMCMMTAASVSVSMEGKHFWIVKSLPVSAKTILDAKVLTSLLLMLPFYLVSELFLFFALEPEGMALVWQILIPVMIAVFSCVFGVAVNLKFPQLEWENEVSVVKQSLAALLGGLGGLVLSVFWIVAIVVAPGGYADWTNMTVSFLLMGLTVILYVKNCHTDLKKL